MLMNAFQCYLKRMKRIIPMEILASKQIGFNLGIKCIRGAYMDEERRSASAAGRESPVWDTVEETHACYNGNVEANSALFWWHSDNPHSGLDSGQ